MAITKKTEGHLTITDLTDITDIYLQYGLALASATVTNSYTFSGTGEVGWSTTYPTWVPGYQVWIRQVRIKEGISNPEYGTPYIDTAVNQLNTRISSSETNITALQTKLKRIWINEITSGDYVAGTYAASGINGTTFIESNPQTYGYNTLLRHNALDLRYNTVKMTSLTTAALTFYIPTQDNSNNWIQGNKGLELSADGLKFFGFDSYIKSTDTVVNTLKSYYTRSVSTPYIYTLVTTPTGNPSTNNYYELEVAAELTSVGLKLTKGGIEAGGPNQSGFIYLSTEDYPLREFILTEDQTIDNTKIYYQFDSNSQIYIDVEEPNVSEINTYYELTEVGISINNYTPTKGDNNLGTISNPAWRQVIGTKFGVDSAGNLYASGANISGGEIGRFIIANDLHSGNLGEEDSVWVSTGTNNAAAIGGINKNISGWAFTAGNKFGVTKDGDLYASNVAINGSITIMGNDSNIYTRDEVDDITETSIKDIEKIINIEDWLQEYGSYSLTEDTISILHKNYFADDYRLSEDTTIYEYNLVDNPTGNPQTQNWYELNGDEYIATSDTIVQEDKQYYTRTNDKTYYTQSGESEPYEYTPVNPEPDDSPTSNGWYEIVKVQVIPTVNPSLQEYYQLNSQTWSVTLDTIVDVDKQYFERFERDDEPGSYYYVPINADIHDNPSEKQWYELTNDTYIQSPDTTLENHKLYFSQIIQDSIISYKPIMEYIPNPSILNLYELDNVKYSISNYIASHVKLKNNAIIIQADNTKACVHISLNGIVLKDNDGTPVASFAKDIILGNKSEMHLELSPGDSNTLPELGFYDGNTKVAYVNSNTLNINQGEIKEKLRIGQFEWRTQGTNRISLVYAPTQQ